MQIKEKNQLHLKFTLKVVEVRKKYFWSTQSGLLIIAKPEKNH